MDDNKIKALIEQTKADDTSAKNDKKLPEVKYDQPEGRLNVDMLTEALKNTQTGARQ